MENGTNLYSAWSTIRSVTIAAGLPGKPTVSFDTDATTDSTLTLEWTVPETNGARITGYRVERNDRGNSGYDNWVRVGTTGASVTTYTDRNLYSGEWLCYRVAATSNVGTGPYSDEECESTTGQYAYDPDPPILRLSSVSPTGVTIAWDPPADDGGRPVTNYVYEMSDAQGSFHDDCEYAHWDRELWPEDPERCFLVAASQRTKNFSGLTPGESYSFRVRTVTAYTNGDWGEVHVRLPAARDNADTEGITEDLQLRVSPTSVTVNEGRGEARYTVRLNKAPQDGETIPLDWGVPQSSPDFFIDYQGEDNCSVFGGFNRDNWSRGCTFTLSAAEDPDAEDRIIIMEHRITVGSRSVSGPSVRVLVRDND